MVCSFALGTIWNASGPNCAGKSAPSIGYAIVGGEPPAAPSRAAFAPCALGSIHSPLILTTIAAVAEAVLTYAVTRNCPAICVLKSPAVRVGPSASTAQDTDRVTSFVLPSL